MQVRVGSTRTSCKFIIEGNQNRSSTAMVGFCHRLTGDSPLRGVPSDGRPSELPTYGGLDIVAAATANRWGMLCVPDPIPTVDGLLAANALERGMTLVTRNTRDVDRTGVATRNPFGD